MIPQELIDDTPSFWPYLSWIGDIIMALPREPQRRQHRLTHLDASVKHVEDALLSRAREIHARGSAMQPGPEANTLLAISAEFLALADEIHWW